MLIYHCTPTNRKPFGKNEQPFKIKDNVMNILIGTSFPPEIVVIGGFDFIIAFQLKNIKFVLVL